MRSTPYIFIILLILSISNCFAESPTIQLNVGVYDNYPKIFIDDNGNPGGIFIEVLIAIAKKEGYKINYVEGDWHQLYKMLLDGEIDVLPDMAFSHERDSLFSLTRLPLLTSWLEIFTTKSNLIHSIKDLDKKKVGVLKGGVQEAYSQQRIMSDFDIHFELHLHNSYTESVIGLKNNEVDYLIAGRFFYYSDLIEEDIIPTGLILRPADLYYAFTKDKHSDIIATFDRNISKLKNDPKSTYYKSLHKYLERDEITGIPQYIKYVIYILLFVLVAFMMFILLLNYRVKVKTEEIKIKNEQLIKSKEKAEESDHLKTVFLQNMSHEIRTPLNVILGYLDLMRDKNLNEEKKTQYIDIINQGGQRLSNTINNIIEISKIESNQLDLHITDVDIDEMMMYHLSFFMNQAEKKGISIKMADYVKGEEAKIRTDKSFLEGILTNLIDNAIKFTKAGFVEFGNYIKGDNVVFYVKDTGIGIPSYKHHSVFESFIQADNEMISQYEGSGLGLSITKAYIEALNGKIWLESETLKGSIFYFSIPYIKSEIAPQKKSTIEEVYQNVTFHDSITILVAEDDELSYDYISRIIGGNNIKLLHALTGEEAVELVKTNRDIKLVLMDIKMPGIDGIEATKQIRKFNKELPIIAQTAYAFSGDKAKVIEAGCNDYIAKPINREDLKNILQKHAEFKSQMQLFV
ncbi:MAG: response regulator [Bacteroidetes bacterium]|nr:response regulator [Bacteroidota bacterium]